MRSLLQTLCLACLLGTVSCHPADTQKVTGGKGGHVTIKAQPWNNGKPLSNSIVYIKYAATEMPANKIFDDSATCVMIDSMPTAVFTDLTKGMYYVYTKGYDTSDHRLQFITGGVRVNAPTEDTFTVNPPVMEL